MISKDITGCFTKKMMFFIFLVACAFSFENVFAKLTEQSDPLILGSSNPCYDMFYESKVPYYEKELIGDHNAYSMDFPAGEEEFAISSNTFYIKEDASSAFWKELLLFSSHVMSIYNTRKVNLGYSFLTRWSLDIKKNRYNSFLVRVFSPDKTKTIGTVRFVASDILHVLPLEKFLNIRLDDSNFDRYEIGLLTVNKGLSIEERYRVHLELWFNLVSFFKERHKATVKVHAFSDVFGTRMYTHWGFKPIESYYKDGKRLFRSMKGYQKGLQLDNGVQMEVLEYELSRDNLKQLLYHISNGRYDLHSDIVVSRLKALQLDDVFEEEHRQHIDLFLDNLPSGYSWGNVPR